jgi:hypothetical protein
MMRSTLKRVADEKPKRFTNIPNELIYDEALDWRAKSTAVYLWSLKDGADISTHALAKSLRMGHAKVREAITALINGGWLRREENRGPQGGLYQYVYLIHPARRISGSTADPEQDGSSGSTAIPVTGSTAIPLTKDVSTTTSLATSVDDTWADPWVAQVELGADSKGADPSAGDGAESQGSLRSRVPITEGGQVGRQKADVPPAAGYACPYCKCPPEEPHLEHCAYKPKGNP